MHFFLGYIRPLFIGHLKSILSLCFMGDNFNDLFILNTNDEHFFIVGN